MAAAMRISVSIFGEESPDSIRLYVGTSTPLRPPTSRWLRFSPSRTLRIWAPT